MLVIMMLLYVDIVYVPDYQKFVDCCLVLTMLLWTGEPLPVNHYGQFTNEEVTSNLYIHSYSKLFLVNFIEIRKCISFR